MATKPGKIVKIPTVRGAYAPRQRLFVRNGKALKVKGAVLRGGS